MLDFQFWVAIAPLRAEYVARAFGQAAAWAKAPADQADELFLRLSKTTLCLTSTDRDVVLDHAAELLGAPEGGGDRLDLLHALASRLRAFDARCDD
jgi:hypothetical protein